MEIIAKENDKTTFELSDTATVDSVLALPTREEAKAQGLTADEIERAEKKGIIQKKEEKKEEPKAADPVKAEEKTEEEHKAEATATEKPKSTLPDFSMTPEQEKVFLATFPPGTPHNGLYFRMKNERQARQAAEAKAKDLEARIAALESTKRQPEAEFDELGNPVDPDEKPLTMKQLREIQQKEAEEIEKRHKENESRAKVVVEAQELQEQYARSVHADFDDTVTKAKDLIQNLDKLVPEKWRQAKVIKMVRDLQVAAARADELDLDDYNASLIAYEIGQLHPSYGTKAEVTPKDGSPSENGKPKDPKKANGGYTPGQMKRIEENTQRRASSASVTGGSGTRSVVAEDIDAENLNQMSYAERQKFKQKHPDLYAKLLRG
jgi:hypothetical protein